MRDTTKTTYTGRTRALGGGWYGARPWPSSEQARAEFALKIALRLASGYQLTRATDGRHGLGNDTAAHVPTREIRAATNDAERDRATDRATGYAMLQGSLENTYGLIFHGGRSEHGYGSTFAPLPDGTDLDAHTLALAFGTDWENIKPRTGLRVWQTREADDAKMHLARQWLAEAADDAAKLSPLDRARRIRAAALVSAKLTRAACNGEGIGTSEHAAALAAYGLSCIEKDDHNGARAFAEFATDEQRDTESEPRGGAMERLAAAARAAAKAADAADAKEQQTATAIQSEPTHDYKTQQAGSSESHERATITAASDAIETGEANTANLPAAVQPSKPMLANQQGHHGGAFTMTCGRTEVTVRLTKGRRR